MDGWEDVKAADGPHTGTVSTPAASAKSRTIRRI